MGLIGPLCPNGRYHPVPNWAWDGDGSVRVSDKALRAVVFIGALSDRDEFIPHGTGFFICSTEQEHTFQNLVTAAHVITGITGDVYIRVNLTGGQFRVTHSLKTDWAFHPEYDKEADTGPDVAIMPAHYPHDTFDIACVKFGPGEVEKEALTDAVITGLSIGIGDPVFFPGMIINHLGEKRNLPIARFGHIARMPSEPILTDHGYQQGYLVEARSINGLSGSPVFVQHEPFRVIDGKVHAAGTSPRHQTHYFMGVLLGHFAVENPPDTANNKKVPVVEQGTGLAVVLPWQKLLETMMQPVVAKAREDKIMEKKRQTGFRSDSAKPPQEKATEAHPHKEAFTSLLNAAARTKPQAD